MEILINALLTVAIVVALGWVAGKTKIIKQEQDHGFSTFYLNLAYPSCYLTQLQLLNHSNYLI